MADKLTKREQINNFQQNHIVRLYESYEKCYKNGDCLEAAVISNMIRNEECDRAMKG